MNKTLYRELLALLIAALTAGSAAPEAAAQAPQAPDSARMLASLAFLSSDALQGRRTGSEGSVQARAHLVQAFEDAGVLAPAGGFEFPFDVTTRGGETLQGANVVGWVRGSETPDRYIVVSAHYDHVGVRGDQIYNGADDNASGSVAVVELAYALAANPPKHSVILAIFDAEELGLNGAEAFVADPPMPLEAIGLNVNMDMVARGEGLLWAGGAHHTPTLAPILEAVAADAPVELRLGHDRRGAPEGADWTNSSDHAPFHQAGIPFVYFGVEDHPDYHRPTDDFENVDPANFMANVRTIFAAIRALDDALPTRTR